MNALKVSAVLVLAGVVSLSLGIVSIYLPLEYWGAVEDTMLHLPSGMLRSVKQGPLTSLSSSMSRGVMPWASMTITH